ncbi:hypothetical protein [Duncaniella sp.]|uniref:hypothetical protein n=1 Tax=Duncaniella sp. TaxID=2518496 RepID=UPI0023D47461|nr:hypothetical protein [Duncaniella sp.]MDE5903927.1 hypothetical protein [Duncaniella sp.]
MNFNFKSAALFVSGLICSSLMAYSENNADIIVKYDQRDPNPNESSRVLSYRISRSMNKGVSPDDDYVIITREKCIHDFDRLAEERIKEYLDERDAIKKILVDIRNLSKQSLGKAVREEDKSCVTNLINLANGDAWDLHEHFEDRELLAKTSNSLSNKDLKKVKDDFSAGKANKKIKGVIKIFDAYLTGKLISVNETLNRIKLKKNGTEVFRSEWPDEYDKMADEMMMLYDTIPNIYGRNKFWSWVDDDESKNNGRNYRRLINYDLEKSYSGDEILKGHKWQLKKDLFPSAHSYLCCDDLPDVRLIFTNTKLYDSKRGVYFEQSNIPDLNVDGRPGGCYGFIFDGKGALKKVAYMDPEVTRSELGRHNDSGIGKQIAVIAYKENYLDVKSADKKVKDYITLQLGLRKRTAAEEREADRMTTDIANALLGHTKASMKYGNSRKGRAQKNKSAKQLMGAILGGSSGYSSVGATWCARAEEEYGAYFKKLYKFERIDDTRFRAVYVDKSMTPVFEIEYSFSAGSDPYTAVQKATVKKL